MDRREFLGTAAAAGALAVIPFSAQATQPQVPQAEAAIDQRWYVDSGSVFQSGLRKYPIHELWMSLSAATGRIQYPDKNIDNVFQYASSCKSIHPSVFMGVDGTVWPCCRPGVRGIHTDVPWFVKFYPNQRLNFSFENRLQIMNKLVEHNEDESNNFGINNLEKICIVRIKEKPNYVGVVIPPVKDEDRWTFTSQRHNLRLYTQDGFPKGTDSFRAFFLSQNKWIKV